MNNTAARITPAILYGYQAATLGKSKIVHWTKTGLTGRRELCCSGKDATEATDAAGTATCKRCSMWG